MLIITHFVIDSMVLINSGPYGNNGIPSDKKHITMRAKTFDITRKIKTWDDCF